MKWFSAGLTFVNVATMAGLLLGILGSGLDKGLAGLALILATAAAICAWFGTSPFAVREKAILPSSPSPPLPKSKRAQRRLLRENPQAAQPQSSPPPPRRWHFWTWIVGIVFLMFAVRSFCWLLWIDGNNLKIQSPNNLGDLALHLTYIKYFANGVALWPDNPIHAFSHLRYPAGIDLFNSILILQHFDLLRVLVWTGLLGSVATFYALYRWGGAFTIAGFLFNGGIAGYAFLRTHEFIDYQGEKIAWKSIPLTMFVTQRGLLYAIPAGLLLLLHWRRKYYSPPDAKSLPGRRGLVPWWVEWSIYATMPLFHVHTFLALSFVLGFWLIIGDWEMRKQIALLLGAAFLPATWIVWMITDHFQASSILAWAPGWLQSDPAFSTSVIDFWWRNFGLMLPAMIALVGLLGWRVWKSRRPRRVASAEPGADKPLPARTKMDPQLLGSVAFVAPAVGIFLFAILVKTAPWGWDNTKLIIWAYFICLPFLWRDLIKLWPIPVRAGLCFLLFLSGFVSLFGGMKVGTPGYDIADRMELFGIADALRGVPVKERFAAFPTYNHPLLLNGRKLVLGYPGHLWTQGFSEYGVIEQRLRKLMLGSPEWREEARDLHARYLFWGKQEERNYAGSLQPWKGQAAVVATGPWGTIYDLETPAATGGHG